MSQSVFNSLRETWRKMSVMGRIVAIGTVCVSVLYGGAKGDRGTGNGERDGACSQGKMEVRIGKSVLAETNPQSIPTNVNMSSSRARSWSIRGAWDDVFTLKFENDFYFPYGTNLYKAVKVFSQGYVIPFTNPYSFSLLADIGPRISLVPRLSTFYYEYTLSNSYRFVWNNVPIGRHSITNPEPPQLNNFSLELLRSGDVVASSNGVMRTIERTLPFDWDRDGIINERDDEPIVNNGNHFGNSNILPDGANSNNYCWVDIVVSNSISRVTFVGDGESDYPDPDFVAHPNVTYRVYFLIGKTYEIMCAEPIVIANKSSNAISVVSNADKPLRIVWSVTYEIESAARSLARSVRMSPSFISGRFSWSTNACCVSQNQNSATVPLCDDTCQCQGCSQFGFTFHYEGYKLSFAGIDCGCKEEVYGETTQDGAFLNVSFSHSALFYEESYTNAPGDVVGKRVSTNVTITCTAKGGLHGGVLTLTRSGFDKLLFMSGEEIPEESVTLAPNETRVWEGVYAPLAHSEVKDDVAVSASFNEFATGEFLLEEEKLTVLCISFTPQVQIGAFLNRHKWGVGERVLCEWKPSGVDLRIIINYGYVDYSDFYVGETFRYYVCPFVEGSDVLFLECNGLSYKPETEVLFPKYLEATNSVERFYNLESGIPGGAGFNTEVYVCPKYVSFRELSFMEAPSLNSIITGYFNQVYFSNVWYHTVERGAGEWYRIASDNFIFIDEVTMGDVLPLPVNKGSIIWIIPIAWTGGSVTNILPVRYEQSFTMSEFGCLRVSKFGYWVERNIYNERNVSEGVKRCIEVK